MLTHAEQMGSGGGQPGSSGRGREAPSSGWLACGGGQGVRGERAKWRIKIFHLSLPLRNSWLHLGYL